MNQPFKPIRRDGVDIDVLDEQAEAIARAKGIRTFEEAAPLLTEAAETVHAETASAPSEEQNEKRPAKPSAHEMAKADLEMRRTRTDDIRYAKVGLEKSYKRKLEDFARDRDMSLNALILRALDQYSPLKDANIRPKKGDLNVKDGRRLRGSRQKDV